MAESKTYTQAGFDALQNELERLKKRMIEIKEEVAQARSYGDLSENSEYDEAKREEGKVADQIRELEEMISLAHVIDESEIDHSKVSVGSIVEIEDTENGAKKTYHIVGSYETDPMQGKISDQSAIGMSLLGQQAGDVVTVELPNGRVRTLKVLDVHRASV